MLTFVRRSGASRTARAVLVAAFTGFVVAFGSLAGCGSPVPPPTGSGGSDASGGAVGSGGAASGGAVGSGGAESGGAAATGGTGSGGDGASGGAVGSGGSPTTPPALLSETGLYESDMTTLGAGVRPFEPGYQLWSDSAEKKRWIALPDAEAIDTSNMDYWEYPVGTRLWKEFVRDGVRVETRLIQKRPDRGWNMVAYHWREDQTEADAVPDGVMNASGTSHDIPSTETCKECHNRMPDKALGFSAIQLSHAAVGLGEGEWTLEQLIAEGRLTDPPAGSFVVPGDATESEALGYLHANCGHCHQEESSVSSRVPMDLWLTTAALGTVQETSIYLSTVGVVPALGSEGTEEPFLIAQQSIVDSAVYQRMTLRDGAELAMPPVGTEDQDEDALDLLETWISQLPVK